MTSSFPTTSHPAGLLTTPVAELTDATSSVPRVIAALPRRILSTRTPFAKFHAQTFHLHPREPSPDSVVFPLLFADSGILACSGPQLSKRRWFCLLRKRLLHFVIVALNFIYGGPSSVDVDLLRRRPNTVQRAVQSWLWVLMTTCDTPGLFFPFAPGRSIPEFIAHLKEFEEFASQSNLLLRDSYGRGPVDYENDQFGQIVPDQNSLQVQPYTSINASRLKLVGAGN